MEWFALIALGAWALVTWMSRDISPEEAKKLRKRRGLPY